MHLKMAKVNTFLGLTVLFVLYNGPFCVSQSMAGIEAYTGTPSEQTGNDTESGFPPVGEDVLSTSLDKSMMPIYDLTKFFLDEIVAVSGLADLNSKVNLSDEDAVLESLENDWEIWVEHYIAYSIAAIIGILFCLAMPLIGCIICCCRKRGKCGGNPEPMDRTHTKCQRITCGSLLLIFSVLILLAVTSCFLSTRLVRDQTVPTGTMQDISSSLQSVDIYFDNTQEEIWRLKSRLFETSYNQIQYQLRAFSTNVQTQVGTTTGAGPLFRDLEQYVDYLPDVLDTLDEMQNTTESLDSQASYLNNTLDTVIFNFLTDFASCTLEQCRNSKYIMTYLEVTANLTAQDLEPIKQDIKFVLYDSENITFTIQQGEDEYDKIQTIVALASNSTISDIQMELKNYADEFYFYINETIDTIDDMDLSKVRQDINDTITKDVDDIGYYAYISLNAIGSIALLIVTLFFVSLMFGCCGERAGEDAAFCNRRNGASTLVVGMVTLFLLSWLLMICTTAMFLGGGLSYTEVCRHFIFKESQDHLVVLDNMISSYFNMSGPSARNIMTNCDQNLPFYQAFEVDQHYPDLNISRLLDLSAFDFDGALEELMSQNYSIGTVVILNDGTKTHLVAIEAALQNFDAESYTNIAEQDITNYNLLNISQLFDEYANESTDPSIASLFRDYSEQLAAIHNDHVINMTMKMEEINNMITSIESYDTAMNLSVFVPEMESAQEAITSEVIIDAVNVTSNAIFDDITRLANSIEFAVINMIGRCYSVYNAISVGISSICVSFLYPFNAFWFSMGWCLFFFTLSIPVAFSLVTSYRKTVPHIPRPKLHRGRSLNQDADGVRSNLGSGRGQHQHDHQRAPSPMPSAPPHYQGRVNNGFVPDELADYHDDEGFIEYQRIQGSRQPAPRGNPIRPTQNYMIELRPTATSHDQRPYSENGYEDYF